MKVLTVMVSAIFYLVFGSVPASVKEGKVSVWVSPEKFEEFQATWKTLELTKPSRNTKGYFYYGPCGEHDKRDKFVLRVWGFPGSNGAAETLDACKRFIGGVLADDAENGEKAALYTRIHRVIV